MLASGPTELGSQTRRQREAKEPQELERGLGRARGQGRLPGRGNTSREWRELPGWVCMPLNSPRAVGEEM